MGRARRRFVEKENGSVEEEYDPFDEKQSPNMRPIESDEIHSVEGLVQSMGSQGEGAPQPSAADSMSQPLDLTQVIMMQSMRMGFSRVSDELIYTLWFGLLGTSVNDNELYQKTKELPDEMTYAEAYNRVEEEMSGAPFAKVLAFMAVREGKVDDMVGKDYFRKLVNQNISIMRNLKQQGILNWGAVAGQSNMELMPMSDGNLQLVSGLNPVYQKFVTTGEV